MNFFNVKFDGNRITNSEGLDIAISEGQAKILKETGYQARKLSLVSVLKMFQAVQSFKKYIQMPM